MFIGAHGLEVKAAFGKVRYLRDKVGRPSLMKKKIDPPRREKENMDEPQEEFVSDVAVPSHTRDEKPEVSDPPKSDQTQNPQP